MRVDLDQIVFLCVCFFVLKVMHRLSRVDMQIACSLNLFYSQSKVLPLVNFRITGRSANYPLSPWIWGK